MVDDIATDRLCCVESCALAAMGSADSANASRAKRSLINRCFSTIHCFGEKKSSLSRQIQATNEPRGNTDELLLNGTRSMPYSQGADGSADIGILASPLQNHYRSASVQEWQSPRPSSRHGSARSMRRSRLVPGSGWAAISARYAGTWIWSGCAKRWAVSVCSGSAYRPEVVPCRQRSTFHA